MSETKVYSFRYMWKLVGSDTINFKIITDVKHGLILFEKSILALDNLESFGKEYLHEYDCTQVGKFVSIFKKEEK